MRLGKWRPQENYFGENYGDCYIVYSKTRDSGLLDQSNFDAISRELLGEDIEETEDCFIVRFGHWGCGWVETIMIRETRKELLALAEDLAAKMEDYPVLDDEDLAIRESDYCSELWQCLGLREKIKVCAEAGISIFAARNEFYPPETFDYLISDAL